MRREAGGGPAPRVVMSALACVLLTSSGAAARAEGSKASVIRLEEFPSNDITQRPTVFFQVGTARAVQRKGGSTEPETRRFA
jgi:hypothetical protein